MKRSVRVHEDAVSRAKSPTPEECKRAKRSIHSPLFEKENNISSRIDQATVLSIKGQKGRQKQNSASHALKETKLSKKSLQNRVTPSPTISSSKNLKGNVSESRQTPTKHVVLRSPNASSQNTADSELKKTTLKGIDTPRQAARFLGMAFAAASDPVVMDSPNVKFPTFEAPTDVSQSVPKPTRDTSALWCDESPTQIRRELSQESRDRKITYFTCTDEGWRLIAPSQSSFTPETTARQLSSSHGNRIQLGSLASPGRKGGAGSKTWQKWTKEEDENLEKQVEEVGTVRNWHMIKQKMNTDRSVKQLQDHWNDLKKRKGDSFLNPNGPT